MTVLSDITIKRLCTQGVLINDWSERKIHKLSGTSYGIGPSSYDVRIAQDLVIKPGRLTLGSTIEKVLMPHNICANIRDKSTWIRRGIHVFNTHIDPGFIGYVTIEVTNYMKNPIKLKKGTPICQFVFEYLDHPADKPYNGKYQNQPNKPVKPIKETV